MAIIKFDPFRTFDAITRRLNAIAEDFERGLQFEYGDFVPRVDISEDDKYLYFNVELPGLKKEDIKVSITDDNVLMIKGEKKREEKTEEKSEERCFIRVERRFGSFTRSFALPENIKTDSINAKFENGVLNITLEKVEPQKPKETEIQIQ